jgi:hypothetical protein
LPPVRAECPRLPFPLDVPSETLHPPRVRHFFPSLLLLLPACSTPVTQLNINVTAGQETDAFTQAPAVAMVGVTIIPAGTTSGVTASAPPGGVFDFVDNFDNSTAIGITLDGTTGAATSSGTGGSGAGGSSSADAGTIPANTQVMGGQTLNGLLLSSIIGSIPVFAQRKEQWSRPPGGLAASHVNGVVTVTEDRFLTILGGTAATGDTTSTPTNVDTYDLFGLTGEQSSPPVYVPGPQTIVPVPVSDNNTDTQSLFINASSIQLYDYTLGSDNTANNAPLTMPTGITSWSDVTGGAVLSDGAGRAFVVGATRSTGATTAVLDVEVDTNGDVVLTNFPLTIKRAGAAAAYIQGIGLVVAGGSTEAPGVEVLSPTGTAFVAQGDYPADPTVGAGAVTDAGTGMVLVGGVQPNGMPQQTRDLDLSCVATACVPVPIPLATLPVALVNVQAYQLSGLTSLAVGTQVSDGFTLSFVVNVGNKPSFTPKLLREPRKGASVIPSPNATLAVLGGEHADGTPALSVELFLP